MPTINGNTNSSYTMEKHGEVYPIYLERPLNPGEYPVKIEFTTLTGSPNSYYKAPYKSPYNVFHVYICNAEGGAQHHLYTVDSDRFKKYSSTSEDMYKSADIADGQDLAGATLALTGNGRDGCYLRNLCQLTITTIDNSEQQTKEPLSPDVYERLLPQVKSLDSAKGYSRRGAFQVKVEGVDITREIEEDLLDLEVTDNEEDEADDLQINMHDKDAVWLQKWLNDTIWAGAKTKGLIFSFWIGAITDGQISQQKAGEFELDSVKHQGPPSKVTIKAISLGFGGGIRTEERDKAWEGYSLRGIAQEIATNGGLQLLFCASNDVQYNRKEQNKETDIHFLKTLCQDAGMSLKITDGQMVIFERDQYSNEDAVMTITYGDGQYTKWNLGTSTGDVTYDICTVRYTNPDTGELIEGCYKTEEWEKNEPDEEDKEKEDQENKHQELNITNVKVSSIAEAEDLAERRLKLKNQFEKVASFTIPGNPAVMAGLPMDLKGWGFWDGRYMIRQVKHKISSSGYTTQVTLRKI